MVKFCERILNLLVFLIWFLFSFEIYVVLETIFHAHRQYTWQKTQILVILNCWFLLYVAFVKWFFMGSLDKSLFVNTAFIHLVLVIVFPLSGRTLIRIVPHFLRDILFVIGFLTFVAINPLQFLIIIHTLVNSIVRLVHRSISSHGVAVCCSYSWTIRWSWRSVIMIIFLRISVAWSLPGLVFVATILHTRIVALFRLGWSRMRWVISILVVLTSRSAPFILFVISVVVHGPIFHHICAPRF